MFNNKKTILPGNISPFICKDRYVKVCIFENENGITIKEQTNHFEIQIDLSIKHKIVSLKVTESCFCSFKLENGISFNTIDLVKDNQVIIDIDYSKNIYLNDYFAKILIKKEPSLKNKVIFWDIHSKAYMKDLIKKPSFSDIVFCHTSGDIYFISLFDIFLFKKGFTKKIKIKHSEKIKCVTTINRTRNDSCFYP